MDGESRAEDDCRKSCTSLEINRAEPPSPSPEISWALPRALLSQPSPPRLRRTRGEPGQRCRTPTDAVSHSGVRAALALGPHINSLNFSQERAGKLVYWDSCGQVKEPLPSAASTVTAVQRDTARRQQEVNGISQTRSDNPFSSFAAAGGSHSVPSASQVSPAGSCPLACSLHACGGVKAAVGRAWHETGLKKRGSATT